MSVYVEATLILLPPDAGGRRTPVAPREGSYRPFARLDGAVVRARLIEGPPLIAPGDEARVVVEIDAEIEEEVGVAVTRGAEIEILEHDEQLVGIATVIRVCRSAVAV